MKIPSYKRIFKTDYSQDIQPMIDKLALSINPGIENVNTVLNGNVSLRDNVFCTVKDVDVIVDATGTPTVAAGMSLDVSGRVDGLHVIRVDNVTTAGIYPTGQPFISFTQQNNSVIFNNITGLSPTYKWRIRVIAYLS